MSLVQLSNVCSHLQNASRARLGFTSIPNTKLHLRLALALQNQGFISTVVRGGLEPPPAHHLLSHPSSAPQKNPDGSGSEVFEIEPTTRANVSTRRLWLGMKYWNSEPVMSKLELISKPTRRQWVDVEELREIVRGRKVRGGMVKGLTRPGECLFLSTDRGVLEARECVERKVGGMALCSVR